ncbi:chaperone modulator CbpM [Maribacter sp. CXY002]|uniref:chaperone modulator CbpM n=1 Tax=Maribacter luteocoastalis TaxID=3407671 RepID=UPI003B66E654
MEPHLININDFCKGHNIEISFIIELQEYGLLALKSINNDYYIEIEELPKVEKLVRLHHELSINREGIEAIHHLLQRMENMQNEIRILRQRLKHYDEQT